MILGHRSDQSSPSLSDPATPSGKKYMYIFTILMTIQGNPLSRHQILAGKVKFEYPGKQHLHLLILETGRHIHSENNQVHLFNEDHLITGMCINTKIFVPWMMG